MVIDLKNDKIYRYANACNLGQILVYIYFFSTGIALAWMAFVVLSQDLAEIPSDLSFSCEGRSYGYYADASTNCQVFHICLGGGDIKWSFLCPNQTIFNQV